LELQERKETSKEKSEINCKKENLKKDEVSCGEKDDLGSIPGHAPPKAPSKEKRV